MSTEKIQEKNGLEAGWFSKYILNPFLSLLSYLLMIYTSLFILIALYNAYLLPSRTLFPNGTFQEREQLVNMGNIIMVGIGIIVIYAHANKKENN